MSRPIRIAARAIVVAEDQLLLVNAFPGAGGLWCAPGGGAVTGEALTSTVAREVFEETGLEVETGPLAGVSEFHNPEDGFHQIDIFFHATPRGETPDTWTDPEGVVIDRLWVTRDGLAALDHKPANLADMAFGARDPVYLPLVRMVPLPEGDSP